jgi:hypothetical protein
MKKWLLFHEAAYNTDLASGISAIPCGWLMVILINFINYEDNTVPSNIVKYDPTVAARVHPSMLTVLCNVRTISIFPPAKSVL